MRTTTTTTTPKVFARPFGVERSLSRLHNVVSPPGPRQDCGSASKTQCKCTCRRGSGPSAPARARFMGLIGCTRVLCRAVSWSSGMPDDNSEARALCARRQYSRAAGSQQSSRARSERSQRAALRPRPAWPAPPPSWPLLAVCAAAHMQARGALRTIAPIQCLPPCLYAFRRQARDDARGSSHSSNGRSSASSSHSSPGTWATDPYPWPGAPPPRRAAPEHRRARRAGWPRPRRILPRRTRRRRGRRSLAPTWRPSPPWSGKVACYHSG